MIPPAIIPKLAKLVPLLGSDQDGEVVATARAICRTLAGAGCDLHALAAALTSKPAPTFDWSVYADVHTDDQPVPKKPDRAAPNAPSTRWGISIWGTQKIEAWPIVAQHALNLDWTIPKASGGKFLSKADRERLKRFSDWRGPRPTNDDAAWIEGIVIRCHEVRDAWRSHQGAAA